MVLLLTILLAAPAADPDLPRSLADAWTPAEPEPQAEPKDKLLWSVGLRVGFAQGFDADDGGFLLGAQGRLYFKPWLAFEAVIEQHNEDFEDGDAEVRFIPIQASALFYPFAGSRLSPYGVAGVGIHHIAVDYSGTLRLVDDEVWVRFGLHLGAGLDIPLGERFLLNGDVRVHFIDEPRDVEADSLDFWEVAVGISYVFN